MNDALKKLVDELGNDCKCVMCKHKNTIRDALRVAVEGLEKMNLPKWSSDDPDCPDADFVAQHNWMADNARTTLTELSRILGVEGDGK